MATSLHAFSRRRTLATAVLAVVLAAGALVALMPFLFMVSTSLKTLVETLTRVDPLPFKSEFWPVAPQWKNYEEAWVQANFSRFFRNSVIIAAVTVAGVVVTSALAAYAFAKMRFAGRAVVFALLLSTLIIPESVYLVPNFILVTKLGWYDRLAGLTVPFMASAFYIFLLRQFFAQLPDELIESARIDGAGHSRSFLAIMLPLSRAPLVTVIFLAFIASWNALQWPLVATRTERWRPLTVGLTMFISESGPQWHLRMAGSVIAVAPVVLLYLLAQRQFTEAISRSGIKG
jgi:ABC-type glycerol-3-phosphate transport system permease component